MSLNLLLDQQVSVCPGDFSDVPILWPVEPPDCLTHGVSEYAYKTAYKVSDLSEG